MLIPNDSIKFGGAPCAIKTQPSCCPPSCWRPLQGYLDGGYLYIPRRAEHRRAWGERTRRKEETLARNRAIFRDYTAGLGVDELSARYFLAPKSIQRILTLGRRGLLEP